MLALTSMLALIAVLGSACGGGGPSRQEVVATIGREVAVPRFEELAANTSALATAGQALCAEPGSEAVEGARDAWRAARASWIGSEAVAFGPVMERRSESLIAWPEVDTARIEEAISERNSVTAEDAAEFFAATQRGLGAAEYLLFTDDVDGTLSALEDPVRCQYLIAVLQVADAEALAVFGTWIEGEDGGASYLDRLSGEAGVSIDVAAAIDEIGATQLFLLRMLADAQLGMALGETDPTPDPSAIPSGPAANETADLLAQILGIRDIYLGPDDNGLTALIADRSEDADARVRAALDGAVAALEAARLPMRELAAVGAPEARAAYEAIEALEVEWSTDVVSLLGIVVGFSDADGDSG
jgi:predicted lipoprotein